MFRCWCWSRADDTIIDWMRGKRAATADPFKMRRRQRGAEDETGCGCAYARARAHERTHQAIGLGLCGDASKTRDSGTRRTERPMKRSLRSLLSSRVSPSAAPPAARDTKQKHSAMQTHANAGGLSSHLIESQSESQCESKWNFKYVV